MRRFLLVFELLLALQRFDESFLGQVLRIVNVAHDPIDLPENAAQVIGDESLLHLGRNQLGGKQPARNIVPRRTRDVRNYVVLRIVRIGGRIVLRHQSP